ncbi:hypothetical protein FHU12_1363 [Serratia marcescens]|uniref:Uncharacterized protein n=1 Tax=Serratia marcescens TaxID=615 RepID=A0AA46K3J8_SERMA|nr:hypothetical protein [Serratia marcescens]TQI83869.1 hypothetical protein FHU12_1363 [Serratia marcescens]HEJ7119121.1 hypothetical protein [Serratia marcescens]
MQRVASNFQMHANAGYNQSRDLVNQSIVLTFLLMFFVKTFLTSGSFNSELINKTVMGLNGLMLLYVGYAFFIATLAEKAVAGFLALLFLVNIATGHGDYLFGAVFSTAVIILFRRIDMGRGAEMFAIAFVVAGLLMVIPYAFYTNGFVYLDERYGNRLTLGFDNPNTLAYYSFAFFATLLCLIDHAKLTRGMKNIASLVVSALILPVLMYSYSRTCFMLALLMLLLFWLAPLLRVAPNRKVCIVLTLVIVGFQFASVMRWGSNPALDVLLNQALTGRVWFSWQMFQAVGLPNPLFGMNIEPYKPVDFFFIAMFYSAGGIASVVMLFCYFHLLGNMRSLSRFMRWVVVVFLLTTLTETYFLVPVFNVSLLLLCRGKEMINSKLEG